MTAKTLCDIYRSPNKPDTYLYVPKLEGLKRVPEQLLEVFGKPQFAFTLVLTPERPLARAEAPKVLSALEASGYYLQLPPVDEDAEMKAMAQKNAKL